MKILLYMGAMLLLLAAACSEDKGNYNYLPVNTIVEDSIEGTYTVVQFDTLDDKTLSEVFPGRERRFKLRMVDRRSGYFYRSGLSCADHDGT